ncbi:MAG: DUF6348 family protein [Bacillota bacterium]
METEFRILLPDKREIVEFVAGIGATKEQAFRDSLVNFMLTTFHPIYRSFINPEDPHQYVEQILINGRQRELVMGNVYMRGGTDGDPAEIDALRAQLRRALVSLPIGEGPHWIKIVYFQLNGKAVTLAATLDNREDRALTEALAGLDWPRRGRTYMLKQFIVIK